MLPWEQQSHPSILLRHHHHKKKKKAKTGFITIPRGSLKFELMLTTARLMDAKMFRFIAWDVVRSLFFFSFCHCSNW